MVAVQRFALRLPPLTRESVRTLESTLKLRIRQLSNARVFVVGQRVLVSEDDRLIVLRVTKSADRSFSIDVIDTKPDLNPPQAFYDVLSEVIRLHRTLTTPEALSDGPLEVWESTAVAAAPEGGRKGTAQDEPAPSADPLRGAVETLSSAAESLDLEDYVQQGPQYQYARFNTAQFHEDVGQRLVARLRNFLNTYPDIDYRRLMRTLDAPMRAAQHEQYGGQDPPDAWARVLAGFDWFVLLDRSEFWKRDALGKPINLLDQNGRKIKGKYETEFDKVNQFSGRVLFWKQWLIGRMVTKLWEHRTYHAGDDPFGPDYFDHLINCIATIPGALEADSMNQRLVHPELFDKDDVAVIRRLTKVDNFGLFLMRTLPDFDVFDLSVSRPVLRSLVVSAVTRSARRTGRGLSELELSEATARLEQLILV